MADNYLEKQREQYEARKAAWQKSLKQTPRAKPANKQRATPTEAAEESDRILPPPPMTEDAPVAITTNHEATTHTD